MGTGTGHLREDGELHHPHWTGHLTWPGNAEEEEEEEEEDYFERLEAEGVYSLSYCYAVRACKGFH